MDDMNLTNEPSQQDPVSNETQKPVAAEPLNDRIESHIRQEADEATEKNMDKLIDAGMDLIFGKETHYQLFDNIRPEDEVPIEDELGAATTNIMFMLFEKSGANDELASAIIPAGTILLARAVDFINEQGITQVSDENFGEALEMFNMMIRDRLDQGYSNKMRGGQQDPQAVEQSPSVNQASTHKGLLSMN